MAETIISINLESVKEKARQKKEEVDNVRIAVNEISHRGHSKICLFSTKQ